MSEVAGEPVIEIIADELYRTISTIKAGAVYKHDLNVSRRHRIDAMKHLDALVIQEDPEEIERTNIDIFIRQPFEVWVKVVALESDEDPPDRICNRIWADIVKAVMVDIHRGGWASNTLPQLPQYWPDGVIVPISVEYATTYDDPFVLPVRFR